MLRLLAVLAALLVAAPVAAAASLGLVEVRGPNGTLIARGGPGAFQYGPGGSTVSVGASWTTGSSVVLRNVSLFSGQITASRVVVPARGLRGARVDHLEVGGAPYRSAPNTLVALGGPSYLVALQAAVAPGAHGTRRGVVGLRIHVGVAVAGLPAGTELWLGLARAARAPRSASPSTTDGIAAAEIPQQLIPLYQRSARSYGLPWEVLAAINRYETGFGTNLNISGAGAVGWMQFLPSTWARYGTDGNRDGKIDPYDPADAIQSAARYLAAAGGASDLVGAVWAYNHSDAYVQMVLERARDYARISAPVLAPAGRLDPTTLGG